MTTAFTHSIVSLIIIIAGLLIVSHHVSGTKCIHENNCTLAEDIATGILYLIPVLAGIAYSVFA